MNLIEVLSRPVTQEAFGELVGIGQSAVSRLVTAGVLVEGGTGAQWLSAYVERLRSVADGRMAAGTLDLVAERAALARSQREAQELRNAKTRAEYAPVPVLELALQLARDEVGRRLSALTEEVGSLASSVSPEVADAVAVVMSTASREWWRATSELRLTDPTDDAEEAPDAADSDDLVSHLAGDLIDNAKE